MTAPAPPSYAGHRFPAEVISHAVWLYFRFPLSLRHVDEILAARGIAVSHETVRQWGLKFGQAFANQIRRRLPQAGDKWHLDEVAVEDLRREALALARGGPGRDGAGHPGAEPARQTGRQAPLAQAAEKAGAPATRHGHRPDRVAIQRRFTFEVRQPIQWRRIQPRA